MPDNAASHWFDNHIQLSSAVPKRLWKYDSRKKWTIISSHHAALQDLLTITQGVVPKQKRTHDLFRVWLKRHELDWSIGDSELAIYGLREMLRALRKLGVFRVSFLLVVDSLFSWLAQFLSYSRWSSTAILSAEVPAFTASARILSALPGFCSDDA